MADHSYHIKIKKEYASAILKELQQAEAIEIIEDVVPEWQKQEARKRLTEMKTNSLLSISRDDFFIDLDEDDEKI